MTRRLLTLITTAGLLPTVRPVSPAVARPPDTPAEVVAVDIGTLGGYRTVPTAVNGRGQVVGMSQVADGRFHAFLWQDGVMSDLTPEDTISAAVDINERGQILGRRGPAGAWVWTRGRTVESASRSRRSSSRPRPDRGEVAGEATSRRPRTSSSSGPGSLRRGTMTLLRTADDTMVEVVDLNDRGLVVGVLRTLGVERGAVWQVTQR